MTSKWEFAVYMLYACFKGIAWVVANGWRSMLGLVALRAEAVMEWQDRREWDHNEVEAIARLVAAVEEQPNDFTLWENELRERAS